MQCLACINIEGFTLCIQYPSTDYMQSVIKHILAPVQTDTASLWLARQAAELASAHGASLHLLHVASLRECSGHFINWFSFAGAQSFHRLTMEKTRILDTWKHSLEKDFHIPVSAKVSWGSKPQQILNEALEVGADVVAISEHGADKQRFLSRPALSNIIEHCRCQVITVLSGSRDISGWKQVVMPVSSYVPEARIQAIARIAGQVPMKIHLVTATQADSQARESQFYFITETIKRLKPAGNIQVQCGSVGINGNSARAFLKYAKQIGADLLITNRFADQKANPVPAEAFCFMGYA